MPHALIGLGSNLGDRRQTLDAAVRQLSLLPNTQLLAQSRWLETSPVGGPAGQAPFLNGAATIETSLAPLALLEHLQRIESHLKRARHERWSARTLDLDLLLYDDLVLESETLTVPHPRMAFRRFVLEPACEVAYDWRHPTTGWSVAELLFHLQSRLPYVAIAGVSPAARQQLAAAIVANVGGTLIHGPQPAVGDGIAIDPSGPNLLAAIELLDQQANLLAWDATFREPVVSDFWLGQLLAEAATTLDPVDLETFHAAWEERVLLHTATPKLIVWLCDPPDDSANAEAGHLHQLHEELAKLLNRPGWGPVLKTSQHAAISPLTEVVAAIEAMGPVDN